MTTIRIAPTLEAMEAIYRLPRTGGPASPRFQRYVELAETHFGLPAYNPMAGDHALETVERLIAADAEMVVRQAGEAVAARCHFQGDITLAVVLAAPGLWTDRLATEVHYRTSAPRVPGSGMVFHWTREPVEPAVLTREAAAETVRVMWTNEHGPATTVSAILAREGMAYAIASSPFGSPDAAEERAVSDGVEILAESTAPADMASILYGDPAADALGWQPLGIADRAGYRWAVARAEQLLATQGPATAWRRPAPVR